MNIIIMSSSLLATGGARQALYQARGLRDAGHNVVFVSKEAGELYSLASDLNRVPLPTTGLSDINKTLESIMPANESVVLHGFHNYAVKATAYLGTRWKLLSRPVVCAAHRGVTSKPGNPLPYLLPGIRAYIVNSKACADSLPLLWRKKRCHLVNNALPIERLETTCQPSDVRDELNIPSDHFIIGYLAHDKPQKGVKELLESYAAAKSRLPLSTLVIVGVTPEKWIDNIIGLNIESDVRLVPRTEHVANYLQSFSLMAFTSYFIESQPNVIMEAMSLGIPVIGSKIGGIPDLIGEQYTFEPKNIEECAAKMIAIANNPDQLKEMSKENFSQKENFSPEYRIKVITGIYNDLLAEAGLKA